MFDAFVTALLRLELTAYQASARPTRASAQISSTASSRGSSSNLSSSNTNGSSRNVPCSSNSGLAADVLELVGCGGSLCSSADRKACLRLLHVMSNFSASAQRMLGAQACLLAFQRGAWIMAIEGSASSLPGSSSGDIIEKQSFLQFVLAALGPVACDEVLLPACFDAVETAEVDLNDNGDEESTDGGNSGGGHCGVINGDSDEGSGELLSRRRRRRSRNHRRLPTNSTNGSVATATAVDWQIVGAIVGELTGLAASHGASPSAASGAVVVVDGAEGPDSPDTGASTSKTTLARARANTHVCLSAAARLCALGLHPRLPKTPISLPNHSGASSASGSYAAVVGKGTRLEYLPGGDKLSARGLRLACKINGQIDRNTESAVGPAATPALPPNPAAAAAVATPATPAAAAAAGVADSAAAPSSSVASGLTSSSPLLFREWFKACFVPDVGTGAASATITVASADAMNKNNAATSSNSNQPFSSLTSASTSAVAGAGKSLALDLSTSLSSTEEATLVARGTVLSAPEVVAAVAAGVTAGQAAATLLVATTTAHAAAASAPTPAAVAPQAAYDSSASAATAAALLGPALHGSPSSVALLCAACTVVAPSWPPHALRSVARELRPLAPLMPEPVRDLRNLLRARSDELYLLNASCNNGLLGNALIHPSSEGGDRGTVALGKRGSAWLLESAQAFRPGKNATNTIAAAAGSVAAALSAQAARFVQEFDHVLTQAASVLPGGIGALARPELAALVPAPLVEMSKTSSSDNKEWQQLKAMLLALPGDHSHNSTSSGSSKSSKSSSSSIQNQEPALAARVALVRALTAAGIVSKAEYGALKVAAAPHLSSSSLPAPLPPSGRTNSSSISSSSDPKWRGSSDGSGSRGLGALSLAELTAAIPAALLPKASNKRRKSGRGEAQSLTPESSSGDDENDDEEEALRNIGSCDPPSVLEAFKTALTDVESVNRGSSKSLAASASRVNDHSVTGRVSRRAAAGAEAFLGTWHACTCRALTRLSNGGNSGNGTAAAPAAPAPTTAGASWEVQLATALLQPEQSSSLRATEDVQTVRTALLERVQDLLVAHITHHAAVGNLGWNSSHATGAAAAEVEDSSRNNSTPPQPPLDSVQVLSLASLTAHVFKPNEFDALLAAALACASGLPSPVIAKTTLTGRRAVVPALAVGADSTRSSGRLGSLLELGRFAALFAQARHDAVAMEAQAKHTTGRNYDNIGSTSASSSASSSSEHLSSRNQERGFTAAWCGALWWLGLRARAAAAGSPSLSKERGGSVGGIYAGSSSLSRAAASAISRALDTVWRLPSVSSWYTSPLPSLAHYV